MTLLKKLFGRKESRAYLILLWNTEPWSASETEQIVTAKRRELGRPTKLLKTAKVDGPFPTGPDEYVVSLALLACREAGIAFDSKRDEISFSGGIQRPGVGLGLITIKLNQPKA